jgi:hypothetical protein
MAAADTALTWRCSLLVNSKTPTLNTLIGWDFLARPKEIRTPDPQIRSLVLYTQLWVTRPGS